MSVLQLPPINVDRLEDISEIKEYLRDYMKKLRFLSSNLDSDNYDRDEYKKVLRNASESTEIRHNLESMILNAENLDRKARARIRQTAEEISLLVQRGNMTTELNLSPEKIYIQGNHLEIQSDNLILDRSGNLSIRGEIVATGGNFGAFQIMRDEQGEYLDGGAGSIINTACLSGANIETRDLDIRTDTDIENCNINFEGCRLETSPNTYLGWFYCDDVHASGNVYANCGQVHYSVTARETIYCYDIWSDEEGIAWSDQKLKKDICEIDGEEAINFVMKLRPVKYKLLDDERQCYGLIAQEVLETGDPYHIVIEEKDGYYGIQYGKLHGILAAAMKELWREVEEMECLYSN